MRAQTASADITPSERIEIAGQMQPRFGEYVHDPLTINAVGFEDADTHVVLVSCDLLSLGLDFIREVQSECERKFAIPGRSVLIACTHTHLAPYVRDNGVGKPEPFYLDRIQQALVDVVGRSLSCMEEVRLYAGAGWIDQMGFNRRGYHKDGTVDMYYGSWNEDYAGVEGPRDGEVGVIFGRRDDGSLKFVIPSFSTHPNSMDLESFYSADLVGAVRNHLRLALGSDLAVIYLTGAAGNTAPSDLSYKDINGPWCGEEGWRRSGLYLGSEIVKVICETNTSMGDCPLSLNQSTLQIPIREMRDFEPPRFARTFYEKCRADWPRFMREESPVEVRVNVLRLGDAAICTNPGELYVEFGLAIKRQSPARVTLISELTDGCVGYIPTPKAIAHGGYSGFAAYSSKLAEDAGEHIVESSAALLSGAFGHPVTGEDAGLGEGARP